MGGKDGYNVGFIFNASLKEENDDCSRGINCMIEESITELVSKYQDILESELDVFQQVSIEEWEIVMPTRHERTEKVMSLITGGFRGRTIPVGSLHYPPWMIFNRDSRGRVDGYSGLIFTLLDEVAKKLNFTYIVKEPRDGKWGDSDSGSWNGLIRQVIDNEVMLSAAAISVSKERQAAVNFSETIDMQPYTFLYRRPTELTRYLLFIDPFTPMVWLYIAAMTLLIGPIFWVIHRYSYYYRYYDEINQYGLFQLQNCMW